jgi:4-aminobutyrate aminotransferase-like enzyme
LDPIVEALVNRTEADSLRADQLRHAADRHVLHSVERGRGDRRLVLDRANGSRVWDVDGREYLDAVSGTNGPALVGHSHPEVRAAIAAQLELIADHFYVYDSPPVVELATRLAQISPNRLDKTIFCPGGGDGVEAAVKLAMRVTGKAEVVSLYGAYHGLGLATSGLGGMPALRKWMPGAQRWPTFRQGPAADCYRRPRGLTESEWGVVAAEALEATIAEGGMNQVAALIIEPVQGPGGHIVFPQSWFDAVQDICRRHEVLLIVDEVQTGLGRCGEMFASDLYGLQPDILVLGKALGGGLPFGATMARSDLIPAEIESEPWVAFTFQNQPIGAAAALAVLEIIERERLPERAQVLGARATERLNRLRDRYSCIGDVRGPGLFIGIDLVVDRDTREPATEACARAFDHALDIGLLTWFGGAGGNVLKLKPPLTITDDDFDEMMNRIEAVIDYVETSLSSG